MALSYVDRERDYLSGTVTAIAPTAGQLEAVASGLTLDLTAARATAERLLQARMAQRDTIQFTAPPSLLALEAGDAVEIDGAVFEITELRDGLARSITAQAVRPELEITSTGARPGAGGGVSAAAAPVLALAELPPTPDDIAHAQLALGAFAQPWPGTVSVTNDATGARLAMLGHSAAMGELTAPLSAGGIFVWDTVNAVELTLYWGHLSSRDDDEVLAGANRIAVANDAGDWEVIAFAEAELIAPQSYRLTRLLRGQMGTDFAIGATSAGNRVLVLDSDATLLPVPAGWLGTTVDVRSFAGRADAEGTLSEIEISIDPVLPLAPCHLTATRTAGGNDVALIWTRRSRADADSWTPDDAPLDFSPEGYTLTVFNGVSPVRTIAVGAPAATYTSAQQTTDFGSPPTSFTYTVAQLSALYGAGPAATGTFTA